MLRVTGLEHISECGDERYKRHLLSVTRLQAYVQHLTWQLKIEATK